MTTQPEVKKDTVTISATRALSSIKSLVGNEDPKKGEVVLGKIQKAINSGFFIGYAVGEGNAPKGFDSVEEFETRAKASLQSVLDSIKRYRVIKRMLILSNAGVTDFASIKRTVVLLGKDGLSVLEEMTPAEVIEMKKSLRFEKKLLKAMKDQQTLTMSMVESINIEADKNEAAYIKAVLGENTEGRAEDVERTKQSYQRDKKARLINPLNIADKIAELEEFISQFETEADTLLSEVNVKTTFDIPVNL